MQLAQCAYYQGAPAQHVETDSEDEVRELPEDNPPFFAVEEIDEAIQQACEAAAQDQCSTRRALRTMFLQYPVPSIYVR